MNWKTRSCVLFTSSLCLTLSLNPASQADDPPLPIEPTVGVPADARNSPVTSREEATAQDAKIADVSIAEIEQNIAFSTIVAAIREQFPNDFAYARQNAETGDLEVWFKDEIPPGALKILANNDNVKPVANVGFSDAELNQQIREAIEVAAAQLEAPNQVSAVENVDTRTIEVTYNTSTSRSGKADPGELAVELSEALSSNVGQPIGFGVTVEYSPTPMIETQAFDGG